MNLKISSAEEAKNKKSFTKNVSSLMQILVFVKPYKLQLLGALTSLIIVAGSILTLGQAIRLIIDRGFGSNDIMQLRETSVFLLVIIVIIAIASYFRASTVNIVCDKIEKDIKTTVYKHIIKISPAFFEINKTSDIIARLTVDTTLVNSVLANLGSFVLRSVIMTIGAIVMLLIISPILTLYILGLIPFLIIPLRFFGKKVKKLSRENQDKIGDIGAHIEENLNGIKTVQAYNKEEYESDIFNNICSDYLSISIKRFKMKAILTSLVIFLTLFTISYVINIGGYQVLQGDLTAGELSSFIFYSIMVAASLGGISEVVGELHRASAATDRIIELLNVTTDIIDPKNPKSLPDGERSDIKFEKVCFNYPSRPDQQAIDNISFEIKTGETVAIVGPSGVGKSTLYRLLLRFYDPNSGEIKLNDIDIKDLSLKELRDQFALVRQDPVIFSATAYDNIRFSKPEASEAEIRSAAKTAEILEFLDSLPDGLNSFVGEKGVRLSGGQKQRIAIARAILKDPKILLLDEATSSLDTKNEKLVQKALDNLRKNRTTIIIAHRISTVENADHIIVLDEGKINAIGKHKDLIKQDGLYAKLALAVE